MHQRGAIFIQFAFLQVKLFQYMHIAIHLKHHNLHILSDLRERLHTYHVTIINCDKLFNNEWFLALSIHLLSAAKSSTAVVQE